MQMNMYELFECLLLCSLHTGGLFWEYLRLILVTACERANIFGERFSSITRV
jgi:hypothetical protein